MFKRMTVEGKFTTPFNVSPLPDGINWILKSRSVFHPALAEPVIVPKGFITDFASIPPLATIFGLLLVPLIPLAAFVTSWCWPLVAFCLLVVIISDGLNCDDRLDAPATAHDFLYRTHSRSRQLADAILREGMRCQKVPFWKAFIVWFNVRIFGWKAWNDNARKFHLHDAIKLSGSL
jgi:hypothetical protein